MGNTLDVDQGKWKRTDSGVGAGVDSYYEYLLKVSWSVGVGQVASLGGEREGQGASAAAVGKQRSGRVSVTACGWRGVYGQLRGRCVGETEVTMCGGVVCGCSDTPSVSQEADGSCMLLINVSDARFSTDTIVSTPACSRTLLLATKLTSTCSLRRMQQQSRRCRWVSNHDRHRFMYVTYADESMNLVTGYHAIDPTRAHVLRASQARPMRIRMQFVVQVCGASGLGRHQKERFYPRHAEGSTLPLEVGRTFNTHSFNFFLSARSLPSGTGSLGFWMSI